MCSKIASLQEILVGLQRTFDTCLIEPIDMLALGDHPVDLYLSDLCIKFLTLEQLRSEKKKVSDVHSTYIYVNFDRLLAKEKKNPKQSLL